MQATASHGVPVYTLAFTLVPIYTDWWERHMGVNNLPNVVTQRHRGQESNSQRSSHESDATLDYQATRH